MSAFLGGADRLARPSLRESFAEQNVDLARDERAALSLALRAKQALAAEDFQELARVARVMPVAVFMRTASQDGEERHALEELVAKNATVAFDAGLAWGTASGRLLESAECQEAFKSYVGPFMNSSPQWRRAPLAFALGAAQSPMAPQELCQWLWSKGFESLSMAEQFGAPELEVWGEAWAAKAKQEGRLPAWCARVLAQALRRWSEGAAQEAAAMLKAAHELGEPREGWLSRAWNAQRERLDEESELMVKRLSSSTGSSKARELSFLAWEQAKERWEDLGARICEQGPPSWTKAALDDGAEASLRAKVEKAALGNEIQQAQESCAPASLGGLRL